MVIGSILIIITTKVVWYTAYLINQYCAGLKLREKIVLSPPPRQFPSLIYSEFSGSACMMALDFVPCQPESCYSGGFPERLETIAL